MKSGEADTPYIKCDPFKRKVMDRIRRNTLETSNFRGRESWSFSMCE